MREVLALTVAAAVRLPPDLVPMVTSCIPRQAFGGTGYETVTWTV
jgi:hypothetical protein